MTQIAWAGTGSKNEEDGKLDDKSNVGKPSQPEEKKEKEKSEEAKKDQNTGVGGSGQEDKTIQISTMADAENKGGKQDGVSN